MPNDSVVAVLSFLASHVLDGEVCSLPPRSGEAWHKVDTAVNLMIHAADFEKLLGPIASSMPGRSMWDRFLDQIWAIDSLHALHEFFDRRLWLLAKSKEELEHISPPDDGPPIRISRNSPLGTFLRQAHVEFTRLPFHRASQLWKSFVKYRQPTAEQWRRRDPKFGQLSFDSVLIEGEEDWGANAVGVGLVAYPEMLLPDRSSDFPVSTDEIEDLLEFQIRQMQRELASPRGETSC